MRNLATLAMCVVLASCGGGGGGSTPPPPPQPISVTFTPAPAPGGAAVYLSGPATPRQGTFTLEVNAQSLPSSTYGVAFDLDFNPNLVRFTGHTAGTFLEAGGAASYQITTDPANSGKLIVGVTLLGASSGVSGSGRIVSLAFSVGQNTGTSTLVLGGNAAQNANGQPIAGVTWAAGTLQASR